MRVSKAKIFGVTASVVIGCWTLPANSYDVLLNVTGSISGNTCTVSTISRNIDVSLGNIGSRQFLAVGSVSQIKTPFTIRLEECGPTFEGAKITFSGIQDSADSRYLKIDDGGATGVAVEIMDGESQLIPLSTTTSAFGSAGQESVDILFYARLIATAIPVSSGNVTATAIYTVEYL